jgi:pyruvate/2-oxoglutarate dehydrogenase complex dihydrolipoamide dehydrogenase (E3) component
MRTARRGAEYGFRASEVEADWPRIRARKDEVVGAIVDGLMRGLQRHPRLALVRGWAQFLDPHRLSVGDQVLEVDRVILASGVRPRIPEIAGLEGVDYLTNETIMDMEMLPASLVIVGGGPEAMEFGQIFRRFGVSVTILQRRDHLLPREDPEISDAVATLLRDEGVAIYTNAVPTRVEHRSAGVTVVATVSGQERRFNAERLLMATGRRPHGLAEMQLNAAGIEGDPEQGVRVDQTLRTTAPNVWAIGDVLGQLQHQHFSVYTGRLAARNALTDAQLEYDTFRIPGAVFTDPEVASIGLTAAEAEAEGHRVKVGYHPVAAISRARAMGERRGFIKIVADAGTDRLLGMHVLAPMGADLLPQGVLMMQTGSIAPLRDVVYIHPTLSEGLRAAAMKAHAS